MSAPPRPEPGICYGAFPTQESAEARSLEAVHSLVKFLGVTPGRALALLEDPAAYVAEIRSRQPRMTGTEAETHSTAMAGTCARGRGSFASACVGPTSLA